MEYEIKQEEKFKFIEVGEGEPIVLLHGLFGALSNFSGLIEYFRQHYKVIVPMLPLFELDLLHTTVGGLEKFVLRLAGRWRLEPRWPGFPNRHPTRLSGERGRQRRAGRDRADRWSGGRLSRRKFVYLFKWRRRGQCNPLGRHSRWKYCLASARTPRRLRCQFSWNFSEIVE